MPSLKHNSLVPTMDSSTYTTNLYAPGVAFSSVRFSFMLSVGGESSRYSSDSTPYWSISTARTLAVGASVITENTTSTTADYIVGGVVYTVSVTSLPRSTSVPAAG